MLPTHVVGLRMSARIICAFPRADLHTHLCATEAHVRLHSGTVGKARYQRKGAAINQRADHRHVLLLADAYCIVIERH